MSVLDLHKEFPLAQHRKKYRTGLFSLSRILIDSHLLACMIQSKCVLWVLFCYHQLILEFLKLHTSDIYQRNDFRQFLGIRKSAHTSCLDNGFLCPLGDNLNGERCPNHNEQSIRFALGKVLLFLCKLDRNLALNRSTSAKLAQKENESAVK